MSTTFSPEQWAEIESRIADGNNLVYQTSIENTNAQKNISQSSSGNDGVAASAQSPNLTLPISSAPPMLMTYYPTQANQIIVASTNPILSMPGSVATPNPTIPTATTTRPLANYGSTYMPQFLPKTSSPTPPMPLPQVSSSTMDDGLANLREEMAKMLRENFGVELPQNRIYQKPYPEYFDAIQCPLGYKIPDFVKFNGEGAKTTWEHVSQYLAQLGEAGSLNELKVRLFPLSLTGTRIFMVFFFTTWFHSSLVAARAEIS